MGDTVVASSGQARRAVLAASIGTLVEGYDLVLYGYFAVILARRFFPPDDPTAALLATFAVFALGFAARPIGGLVFGHFGDRFGRRPALATAVLLMAVATAGIAVLPTYASIGIGASVLLTLCRLLQGLSIGGETAGANIFVIEHARTGWSGRAVAANLGSGSVGIAFAAGASLLLAEVLDDRQLTAWGWRLPFALAAPLGLIGLYLRLRVADSPALRAEGAVRRRFPLGDALRTARRGMLVFAGFAVMVLLGTYLLIGYLPSHLTRVAGLSTSETFAANLAAVIALAAGAVLGGVLVDRFPLWRVAAGCAIGLAVTVVPGFLLIALGTLGSAMAGLALFAVCLGVGNVVGASLSPVLFAVPIRYTATAFALNLTGALFAGTGPYVSAWLVERTGHVNTPAVYVTVAAIGGLLVALFGIPREPRPGR